MEITLDFTTLAEEVKRSLSIIGKRSTDENGNLLFKDITLSSLEEPLLNDYLQQAVIDLTTETDTFITASTDTSITLTFSTNHNEALNPAITKVCKAYCVSYALYSWLSIVAPGLKEKYMGDCKRQSEELVRLIHNKTVPSAPSFNFPDTITLSFPVVDTLAATPNESPVTNVVPVDTLMSHPYIIAVGEETEISYVLSCNSGKRPIDDIIVRADDGCCMPCLDRMGQWLVRGIKPGVTIITLQSRHDDRVFARFALKVTE